MKPADEPDRPDPSSDSADDDPRLFAAVQEYVAALEAGRRPNRQELLARHPDIAAELSECLNGLAFVRSAAEQIKGTSEPRLSEVDAPVHEDLAVEPLGDFKLVREIGRGGMGVVYEAVQLSLGRRVAVKVLPLAAALDSRHLQRFRNEAQAAAQLHHTNIVPVYAVGCERSVHFYAMQLIEGQSLAEVVRALRTAAGRNTPDAGPTQPPTLIRGPASAADMTRPSRRPPHRPPREPPSSALTSHPGESLSSLRTGNRASYFRTVARLGLQAAEALDYAHALGVVHRDIKPANLLLDVRGNLWVTDFGLAQFYADAGGLTTTGDLVGTFRYMSPEQASGRAVVLDQRTDIYSLGVTLYELLTLERALPGETREQLLHQVDSVDPKPPRSIDKSIPQELETILEKAAAKDPAERYPSARALADDLGRFLRDEPIHARPPSAWDKAVKWTRRHKALALSAVAMLVLTAVGLLVSTLLIAREQGKTKAALVSEQQRAREADEQRALADRQARQAREAVDFFTRIATQEMDRPQFADVRKELLRAALGYYQEFLDERQNDPSVAAALESAQASVKTILTELAALDEFLRVKDRAELLGQPPVRAALHLTPGQARAVEAELDDNFPWKLMPFPEAGVDYRVLTPEKRRAMLADIQSKIEAALAKMLTPEQTRRLRQIARQARGPWAFTDPDVAEALGLTRQQTDSIRVIQAPFRGGPGLFGRGGPPWQGGRRGGGDRQDRPGENRGGPHRDGGGGPGGGQDRPPRDAGPQREAVEKIVALLTPPQAETWRTLTGEPVNVRPGQSPFGDFGGPGRGPPR